MVIMYHLLVTQQQTKLSFKKCLNIWINYTGSCLGFILFCLLCFILINYWNVFRNLHCKTITCNELLYVTAVNYILPPSKGDLSVWYGIFDIHEVSSLSYPLNKAEESNTANGRNSWYLWNYSSTVLETVKKSFLLCILLCLLFWKKKAATSQSESPLRSSISSC